MELDLQNVLPLLQKYALQFIGGLLVLFIGFTVVNVINNGIGKLMEKRNVDASLRSFLGSLLGLGLKAMVILSALSIMGVKVTSFVAVLGAAGLAVGLALQGSLANFAGGVMILLFKPFKVGDWIEGQGYSGGVKEITLFHTILNPLDNRTVVIPNGALYNGPIVNFSAQSLRRLVLTYGIAYGDDADKAKDVLLDLLRSDARVLHEPNEPMVAIAELGDSSVNFTVRAWVKASDYFPTLWGMNDKVYKTFKQQGLNIPFPQMDVHLHQN